MFICYLIDPLERSVTKVRDGFDRAPTLLETECLQVTNIWTSLEYDDESTIDMVTADEAEGPPLSPSTFAFKLQLGNETFHRHFAGKGVLVVCGNIRDDLAAQVASTGNVESAIQFLQPSTVQDAVAEAPRHTVSHWSIHPSFSAERAPSRRALNIEVRKERAGRKRST
ncbi:hypothetical protein BSFA1_80170 (plasmid) [Burkholderia sp. SFA1]|nr:hypothetical protein BSFA1_80170 [Burkholderia sp. SFA1]